MIRELRVRHRRIFIVMAILLPMLVLIGLAARRDIPPMEELPASVTDRVDHSE